MVTRRISGGYADRDAHQRAIRLAKGIADNARAGERGVASPIVFARIRADANEIIVALFEATSEPERPAA